MTDALAFAVAECRAARPVAVMLVWEAAGALHIRCIPESAALRDGMIAWLAAPVEVEEAEEAAEAAEFEK